MTALDDAWQAALAAEHEAVFAYALLGPQLPTDQQGAARAAQAAHEELRDATAGAIAAAGLTPVAAAGDYAQLYPVANAAAAQRTAIRVEDNCASAWRYLYAVAAGTDTKAATPRTTAARRGEAQQALIDSAVRAARWRITAGVIPSTVPFPGI